MLNARFHSQLSVQAPEDHDGLLDWAKANTQSLDIACSLAGEVMYRRGDMASSVKFLLKSLGFEGASPLSHRDLARAYRKLFEYDKALLHIRAALSLAPNLSSVQYVAGTIYRDLLDIDGAMAAQQMAITLNTDLTSLWGPYFQLSECYFLSRRIREGWKALSTSRLLSGETVGILATNTLPIWRGRKSPHKIAIICDRGIGDIIWMARYIPQVAERCSGISVICRPELEPVLRQVAGVSEFIGRPGQNITVGSHALLSTLPEILGITSESTATQQLSLKAAPVEVSKWKERLARSTSPNQLKIGLVWSGNPIHDDNFKRSMEFEQLAPLKTLEGATFFALQVESRENSDENWAINLGREIHSFEDTMGILANLDVLITVDTAIAHLAGAMWVKTLLLLPFSPDGRWMLGRSDTPWYPTLRLFRQQCLGDWSHPVRAIHDYIRQMSDTPTTR